MVPTYDDRNIARVRVAINAWHETLPADDPARLDERWKMTHAQRAGLVDNEDEK